MGNVRSRTVFRQLHPVAAQKDAFVASKFDSSAQQWRLVKRGLYEGLGQKPASRTMRKYLSRGTMNTYDEASPEKG